MIEDDYTKLLPVEYGQMYRGETPCCVVKFEEPPKDLAAELAAGMESGKYHGVAIYPDPADELRRRMGNGFYSFIRQTRMVCDCSLNSIRRFSKEAQRYEVIKRIHKGYDFAYIADWIDGSTRGVWSTLVMADPRKRAGKSYLVFSFEDQQAATLFKLFQEEKEEEE